VSEGRSVAGRSPGAEAPGSDGQAGSSRLPPPCPPLSALLLLAGVFITAIAGPGFAIDSSATCAGDCEGSGAVTINELVTLVNVALDSTPVAACAAGDVNADGSISIDEIVVAVSHALNGCPAPTEQLAGTVAALAHGLSYLPYYEPVLSAYFSAAGGTGECPGGGSLTSTCEDAAGAAIRIPIVAAQCAIPTLEGMVTLDGTSPLIGTGLCPSVLVPGGWQMAVHSSVQLASPSLTPLLAAQFDLAAAIQSFTFGLAPCRLRGGAAVLDGNLTYQLPAGGQVTVAMQALRGSFVLSDLSLLQLCQPATVAFTLNGDVNVTDAQADPPLAISVTLHDLTVTIHRPSGRVEIGGGIAAPWAGGSATVATTVSLLRPLDQPCFAGGTLRVDAPGVRTQLMFGDGGSVGIDRGAGGSDQVTFASCLDGRLRAMP
jgi:hypothetical protein